MTKKYEILNNTRFYVLTTSLLVSLLLVAWLRLSIPSDQLFYIRTEQIFGLLAILYWYIALLISPLTYVFGKERLVHLVFARRAIGVSAAYFALLHFVIALWGQLGGIGELGYLPALFKWSLAGGGIAMIILLMMATTSFDLVVRFMTFRRWKWLHRLGYVGLVLVVLHIWSVGTHLAYTNVQLIAFAALALLSGLELYRTTKLINDTYLHLGKSEKITLFVSSWLIVVISIFMIPVFVDNYHSQHSDHKENTHRETHR